MRYTIDRFEEEFAICEDEEQRMVSIPLSRLPEHIKEGDILDEQEGNFLLDPEASALRRQAMDQKLKDLFL